MLQYDREEEDRFEQASQAKLDQARKAFGKLAPDFELDSESDDDQEEEQTGYVGDDNESVDSDYPETVVFDPTAYDEERPIPGLGRQPEYYDISDDVRVIQLPPIRSPLRSEDEPSIKRVRVGSSGIFSCIRIVDSDEDDVWLIQPSPDDEQETDADAIFDSDDEFGGVEISGRLVYTHYTM